MGIVLDSTVLIAAERSGKNARGVVEDVLVKVGDTEAALSVITLVELAPELNARTPLRARLRASISSTSS